MEIYLVRHGQVKVINGEYFKSHLSPKGFKQGQNILSKGLLPKPDKVYSSHFIRAKESAKLMADYFSMDFEVKGCLGEWKIQENLFYRPHFTSPRRN